MCVQPASNLAGCPTQAGFAWVGSLELLAPNRSQQEGDEQPSHRSKQNRCLPMCDDTGQNSRNVPTNTRLQSVLSLSEYISVLVTETIILLRGSNPN